MASSQRLERGHDGTLPTLDVFIQTLNLVKDACGIPPAQAVFASASLLLTMIRDTMANDQDCVELGQACGEVCQALDRGLKGRRSDELSQSVLSGIEQLTTTVAEIQRKVIKKGKRNVASRVFHSKVDKEKIVVWRYDIARVLHVFNTELTINTHMMVADIHRNMLTGLESASGQNSSTQIRAPLGESPPPPLEACFGREEVIEEVVVLAENLEPIALIGAGGIGKTSIALTVLHHNRIKARFGENRRFVHCDRFPASRAHFLARLSQVIGAGVENPEDLAPLRPFLSSKDMFIILDNAESVLDPRGTNAQEIYSMVDELCRFGTVCLLITSRITTVPRYCKHPEIPTLSIDAACDIFYGICSDGGRSDAINDLLQRLDFHALSVTLLATTAAHNAWDYNRLMEEWNTKQVQVLQTDYNESLAATIELSLTSPTFCELDLNARSLLGVVAFFPQGIDEKKIDWLFPTISNRKNIFDKFCILSLTYRSNGFITMLAPIRDYLGPRDPHSSPLLCATRDIYFSRLLVDIRPHMPGFEETRWIVFEDANVEHLLNVFMPIDQNTGDIWDVCYHFMEHLHWHKPRRTTLGPKIEALADDHHFKLKCLSVLSLLFGQVGNHAERKRILTHILELERRQGHDSCVAQVLQGLSDVNLLLDLYEEGIQQAKESLEIFERIGDIEEQTRCLKELAWLLFYDKQLDVAEETASRAINLVTVEDQEVVCDLYRVLGGIYHSKGEKKKAIHHFEAALRTASSPTSDDALFWTHLSLAKLFYDEDELEDANAHIERAKLHTAHNAYKQGRAMQMRAEVWYQQRRLEDAKSEVLHALEVFEKLGSAKDVGVCRDLLQSNEQ